MLIYPRWLERLLPGHSRVRFPGEAARNNYFLVSGDGQPQLYDRQLPNSIADINDCGKYNYLVVCLDADEASAEARRAEVFDRLAVCPAKLDTSVTVRVVVQNRCIETWLLGNRTVFSRTPESDALKRCVTYYNVHDSDPELMGPGPDGLTHSQFHFEYIHSMFRERNLKYTKHYPGHAGDESYLRKLIDRCRIESDHLSTFAELLALCGQINQVCGIAPAPP